MSLIKRLSAPVLALMGSHQQSLAPQRGAGSETARNLSDGSTGRRLRRHLVTIGPGFLGQVLALGAMLAPVLARRTDQVQLIVFCSSAAVLLLGPATLGIQLTLPALRGKMTPAIGLACSMLSLTTVCSAMLAALLVVPSEHVELVLCSALLLYAQGLYVVTTTLLIRAGDAARIARMRLHYGLTLLSATCVAVVLPGSYPLVLATVLAYVVIVVVHARTAVRPVWHGIHRLRRSSRLFRPYMRHALAPTLSELATGTVGPLAGVAVVGTGAFGGPWAVVNRIAGGFITLLQQVLMPPVEVDLSRSVRERDRLGFSSSSRRALLLGAAVAMLGCIGALGLAVYAAPDALDVNGWLLMAGITVLFWGPTLLLTPLSRVLNFLGHNRLKLWLDLFRAGGLVLAFFLLPGPAKLVGMAVVAAVASGAIYVATRRQIRRFRAGR
ncbi:hypothetical protein JD79_00975 [Geodermatophilus normandii]|uniref:O-antigen/teichoic acid export membrane protein n=1 Tax=Geodermatophilus normandii TaxID=1137989 RepID=A0A317QGD3_9ACTN|nr:hypothetical protein [Geodermatophilus normandii]PWW21834.1 hypothetical protein JD79_00975 [Geodermatophilus normandii]